MSLHRNEQRTIHAMARALFVQAFADQEEEAGRHAKPGADWMDIAPKTPPSVVFEAYRLTGALEQANGASLIALLAAAWRADGHRDEEPIPAEYAKQFGHYLAMEAVGHGVSWNDNHNTVVVAGRNMTVPDFEYILDTDPDLSPAPC